MQKTQAPTTRFLNYIIAIIQKLFLKKHTDFCFKSKLTDKLLAKPQKLINVYYKNL